MKDHCTNCSRNLDGVCEIYGVLDYEVNICQNYVILVDDLSIDDHIGYDMDYWEEWDV